MAKRSTGEGGGGEGKGGEVVTPNNLKKKRKEMYPWNNGI